MPLTWFSAPASADDQSQLSRQTQFGRQRFVSEQTPDQMVGTLLRLLMIYHLTTFSSRCSKGARVLVVSSTVSVQLTCGSQTMEQVRPCYPGTLEGS